MELTSSRNSSKILSVGYILNSVSDEDALVIFKTIAEGYNINHISKTKLTRKQYYSRLSSLKKAGLVRNNNGRYFLTAFGKVFYDTEKLIENALNHYWKLKAIDLFGTSFENNQFSNEEHKKIIDTLIDNHRIKEIILAKTKF